MPRWRQTAATTAGMPGAWIQDAPTPDRRVPASTKASSIQAAAHSEERAVEADSQARGEPEGRWLQPAASASGSILLNAGTGSFEAGVNYPVSLGPSSVAVGDINGDGHLDIVIVHKTAKVSVLSNQGDGTFGSSADYPTGSAPLTIAVGDLNGDGRPDFIVADEFDNTVSVLLNQCQ